MLMNKYTSVPEQKVNAPQDFRKATWITMLKALVTREYVFYFLGIMLLQFFRKAEVSIDVHEQGVEFVLNSLRQLLDMVSGVSLLSF